MPRFGDFEQYLNNSGDLLNAGKLYFYESGTTTPKTTYADVNQTTPNANPVILTAAGRQPNIFFDGVAKVVLATSADVILSTLDPVGQLDVNAQFKPWVRIFSYPMYSIVLYDGAFYISLINNNLGNIPDTSPTDWESFGAWLIKNQTGVANNEVAVGSTTEGLKGIAIPHGQVVIGDTTEGISSVSINTKGSVLAGNGTLPVAVPVGVNGTVLTANSALAAGVGFAAQAIASGWRLVAVVPAAAASQVDIEGFDSTYDNYVIIGSAVISSATSLLMRWKLGASYDTGANYLVVGVSGTSTSLVDTVSNSINANSISVQSFFYNVNSAIEKVATYNTVGYVDATNGVVANTLYASNQGTGVLGGVRLYCSGGPTITGTFYLYGINKTP